MVENSGTLEVLALGPDFSHHGLLTVDILICIPYEQMKFLRGSSKNKILGASLESWMAVLAVYIVFLT